MGWNCLEENQRGRGRYRVWKGDGTGAKLQDAAGREDKVLRENLAWVSDVEVIEVLTEDRGANKLSRGMRQL